MQPLDDYGVDDLLLSLEAELAKCIGELRCAQGDLDKMQSRLRFALAVLHTLKGKKVNKDETNTTGRKA